ncbi:hypothetical protein A8B75_00565 [Sphingomonadales bacterium EhC05]|nr:hypothetical protein A8B75_00565 [Sphingomonadales bacterium EhC05]
MKPKLIIVYNSDEGLIALAKDFLHKILRPSTYPCSLCMISYGAVLMKSAWRKYLARRPEETVYFHRQDFYRAYPMTEYPNLRTLQLPAILFDRDGGLEMVLGNEELDRLSSVDQLITATESVLSELT